MGPLILNRKNLSKEIFWDQLRSKSIEIEFITETVTKDLQKNKIVSIEYEVNLAFLNIKNKYLVSEYHDEISTHITICSNLSDRDEIGENSQNKLDQELFNILESDNSLAMPTAENKVEKKRSINWGCLALSTGFICLSLIFFVCSIIGFINFLRLL